MKFNCNKCGKKVSPNHSFCKNCGSRLNFSQFNVVKKKDGVVKILHDDISKVSNNMTKNDITEAMLDTYMKKIKGINKNMRHDPFMAETIVDKGVDIAQSGNIENALEYFNEALLINPNLKNAWFNKGYAHYHLGNFKHAIKCFDSALEIDPNYQRAIKFKLISLEKSGSHDAAIKSLSETFQITPKIKELLAEANNYINRMDIIGALSVYDKIININPQVPMTWHFKGDILFEMKNFAGALKCYDTALDNYGEFMKDVGPLDKLWTFKGMAQSYLMNLKSKL